MFAPSKIANLLCGVSLAVFSATSFAQLAAYPTSAAVRTGSQQVFQAQIAGVPDTHPISYSVDGVSGGNSTVGTINSAGVYTAPNSTGTHHVTVKDVTTGSSYSSTVQIYSRIAVDFGSRSTSLHAIPAYLFGAEHMDTVAQHGTAYLDEVKAGGINDARFYAQIPIVFANGASAPNWNAIDGVIQQVSSGGVHILLQMNQTPPYLQPASNPCGKGNSTVMPTDVNAWGQMAAQYVAHLDAKFPGLVTDYEIWNEPNTAALCGSASTKMSNYMSLYRAAAPLMRAQAKRDGANVRIGGPATAGFQSSWVKAMLADPVISQNIDFMSYHDYMFGSPNISAEWNTYYNKQTSVVQKTQNSGADPISTYVYAAGVVAGGKQPQGKNLPIYNSEYNLNWAFSKTCCQNDPQYAPVWNGMYVSELLNSVYQGAPNVISRLVYFGASTAGKSSPTPYFCLLGVVDSNMDCAWPAGSAAQPYPQYFLYQLFGATKYLGLQNGGRMASSISPSTLGNGIIVTSFFTSSLDAIVVVNPTGNTYSNLAVSANNTGLTGPSGTLYQIVNGQSIQSSSLSFASAGGTSYSATISVGPYSVQAISLHH